MKKMQLDKEGIYEYQQNRDPMLMIDKAEEIIPGESIRGYKIFKPDEWFFAVHFPGDPSVPGALQLESMMQLSALMILTLPGNKGKVCYVVNADRLKFARKISPGEKLDIEAKLLSWKRGIGKCVAHATVNNERACSGEFTLVLPDILAEFQR